MPLMRMMMIPYRHLPKLNLKKRRHQQKKPKLETTIKLQVRFRQMPMTKEEEEVEAAVEEAAGRMVRIEVAEEPGEREEEVVEEEEEEDNYKTRKASRSLLMIQNADEVAEAEAEGEVTEVIEAAEEEVEVEKDPTPQEVMKMEALVVVAKEEPEAADLKLPE